MPQGLQVWDASGNVLVDTSKRLSVILFRFALTKNSQTFTMSDELFATNTAFYIAPLIQPYDGAQEPSIILTQSGQTCIINTSNIDYELTTGEILIGVF